MLATGLHMNVSKPQPYTIAKNTCKKPKRANINWCNTPNFTSKKQALTGATKSIKKLTSTTNQVVVTKMMHILNPDHNKK